MDKDPQWLADLRDATAAFVAEVELIRLNSWACQIRALDRELDLT